MASLADKNLPQIAQDEINRITAEAQKSGDWASANKAANDIRAQYGADYTVSAGGKTTYDDNSTISSFTAGSQTSGGKANDLISGWNEPSSTNRSDYYVQNGLTANMSRNQNLAGMRVKQGNYTVTYDEDGYAVSARRDNGASATHAVPTTHANDSAYHQAAYQAAQAGDWEAVGRYINQIGQAQGFNPDGSYDTAAANLYMQELQNQFGYNARRYYDELYDRAYGNGSAAVFDATGGNVKTYADLVALLGEQGAQQMIAQQNAQPYAGTALQAYSQSGYSPASSIGTRDMTEYLRNMFAQDLEAQLAALDSDYQQSVAEYRAQDDLINQAYQNSMNQTAAQNDIQRLYMNEMGLANGLNTGATGQLALGQSAAYQQNIGSLLGQKAQDIAANNLALAQLDAAYRNNAAQIRAQNQSQLNQALYEEILRQEDIAREQALLQQQAALRNQETARENALAWLSGGIMPEPALLEAAGISQAEASMWMQLAQQSFNQGRTPVSDDAGVSNPTPVKGSDGIDAPLFSSSVRDNLIDLGLTAYTASYIDELMEYGGLREDANGELYWAPGWNKDTHSQMLPAAKKIRQDIQAMFPA